MKHFRSFVAETYDSPSGYQLRTDAPSLIGDADRAVTRYDLFNVPAPTGTKKYIPGLDVVEWTNSDGIERSHFIINQKAGALVLLWEPAEDGGIWIYLQETYRAPHSKDERTVGELVSSGAYDGLGVWSLEAPAGGLNYDGYKPSEAPESAAVREVVEETGLNIDATKLLDLLPSGLQISGDINTKRSYLFAANINDCLYDVRTKAVEPDEKVKDLIAFRIRSSADVLELTALTRLCSGTTPAVALAALQPSISQYLNQ